jgi:hypothetical protein
MHIYFETKVMGILRKAKLDLVRVHRWVLAVGGWWLWAVAPAAAQEAGSRPSVEPRRIAGSMEIDGRLDEPEWSTDAPITKFTQTKPAEGMPVSQPTEVIVLYDDTYLYIGARLHDAHPVSTRLGRRDGYIRSSDWFSVSLDTYRDFRTAFEFTVNPSGVRLDAMLSGESRNQSWNGVWEAATEVTAGGWVAEIRIPFSQLRFRPAGVHEWGLQFGRTIARLREEAVFSFTPRSERGGMAAFGTLVGMRDLRPGGRLELVPYAVARGARVQVPPADQVDFPDPFRDEAELSARAGVDLKYRMTSNLTLDATVNPDFGQVEADPAEVNLSAFESRFDERRPFFVEGSDIFSFGGGGWGGVNLFYSRRIGRGPQVAEIDDAVYEDVPDASAILGAAKLSGRTAGGWSLGVMQAVTRKESARYIDSSGATNSAVVEPLANHVVARARREAREGRLMIGGIFTSVNRAMEDDGRIREALHAQAYSSGVDFGYETHDRKWALTGYAAGSMVRGSPAAILNTQLSAARYYQRPDAEHLSIDSAAASLAGYAARARLARVAGEHWRGHLMAASSSPGFEVNDLGFYYDADRIFVDTEIGYVETQPGDVLRSWSVRAGPGAQWNHAGDLLRGSASVEAEAELLSYWSAEATLRHAIGSYDDRLTRGGPLAGSPARTSYDMEFRSDARRTLVGRLGADLARDDAGGWSTSLELGLDIRPAPNWAISFEPELSRRFSVAQYVGAVRDSTAVPTYGRRYLFAELDRTTLSLQTRLDVVFAPELTLEMYLEPFLASGDFTRIKEFAAPRQFQFNVYGEDVGSIRPVAGGFEVDPDEGGSAPAFTVRDRDFRRASMNGNAVLRWEWRPGSTLFLVWQQARSVSRADGEFRLGPGLHDLWSERPDHILLLKMSYWFSR